MSFYDYQASRNIPGDMPFASLIMAAMLRADTGNFERLRAAFPGLADEAQARHNAPGGRLPSDPDGA